MKRVFLAVALVITTTGCSSINVDKYLGNRITCTVAQDKAYVTSLWGWIGISSEIVEEDAEVICGSSLGKK
jgi:hypothetical protein